MSLNTVWMPAATAAGIWLKGRMGCGIDDSGAVALKAGGRR